MPHRTWKLGGRGDPDDGGRVTDYSPDPVDSLQVETEVSVVATWQKKQAASAVFHPRALRIATSCACLNRQRRMVRIASMGIVAMMRKGVDNDYLRNLIP